MESILTQCPRCQTSFKVSDKQLAIAEGFVRCGSCLDVFSAIANRITIKQPVSANPPHDFPEDVYEDDEAPAEQAFDDNKAANAEITATGISEPASAVDSAVFDLGHSVTLKYPVGQLIDADAVIPVNVIADPRTSSFADPDSGFVFDDDIPLGDMVLDDTDLDEGNDLTVEEHAEAEATEGFADASYSAPSTVYKEYTEADAEPDDYIDEVATEITNPASDTRSSDPDSAASYEDALMADDDLDDSFAEKFDEQDETIVLQLDEDFTAAAESVSVSGAQTSPDDEIDFAKTDEADRAISAAADAELADPRPPENSSYEPAPALPSNLPEEHSEPASSGFNEDAITESTPHAAQPYNDADINTYAKDQVVAEPATDLSAFAQQEALVEHGSQERAAAQEQVVADPEAEALFHSIYDTAAAAVTVPAPGADAAGQHQHTPENQEALYEAYAAGLPAEAPAEEPQELMAQGFGATRDEDSGVDTEQSFTAANIVQIDEFQVDSFSAVARDAADNAEEFADQPSKASSRHEKEELRQYLADLEDADALEPLPATTMDAIEAEPLTLEVGYSFRRYVSTFGWFCLSLALVAGFILQVVADNLELIQKSPAYSRYLPLFCRILDCPEPASLTAGIQSLYSQELLVRSHPLVPDALEVSFIFRNDAELPQPFPLVELSFRNSSRQLIANRLFTPEEYLPPELAELDLMPGRSSVQVMLELADPGSEAVDYEIIFREAAQEVLNSPATP